MVDPDNFSFRGFFPFSIHPNSPPGLDALYLACRNVYPDQTNPLQVAAYIKYWLGGPDPLDYISMYDNSGDAQLEVPPHWHYISFGLSDLHGDGRVHEVSGPGTPSGFGFELTFRLLKEAGETAPPTWPAALLQSLAKYVFHSGNTLCAGDHVSWHCALDGNGESRIQHMLMASDPQLASASTPFGPVLYIQIVGVTKDELSAAQRWNGPGVLNILKSLPGAGGPWLVTDMRRGGSMFQLDPAVSETVERGIHTDGSSLSGVSARCSWTCVNRDTFCDDVSVKSEEGCLREGPATCPDREEELHKGLHSLGHKQILPENRSHNCNVNAEEFHRDEDTESLESSELSRSKHIESLHLAFNLESGMLLPLAIRGRVMHGRHFTFKSVLGDTAITLVASSVTGTFVTEDSPYMVQGPWLQVLLPDHFLQEMAQSLEVLATPDELDLPKTFTWPERKLAITVVADIRYC